MKILKNTTLAGMCLALVLSFSALGAEKKLSKEDKRQAAIATLLTKISSLEIEISKEEDGTTRRIVLLAQKINLERELEKLVPTMREVRKSVGGGEEKTIPNTQAQPRPSSHPLSSRRVEILHRAQKIELEKYQEEQDKKEKENDTPAMAQARKEVEKEEKNRRDRDKELMKMRTRAHLTGCGWDTTQIFKGAFDGDIMENMIRVRITNTTPFPYDIETPARGAGLVVGGLCPGGAITLTFSIQRWLDGIGGVQIPLVAKAQPPNAATVIERNQFYLNRQNGGERITNQTWEIRTGRPY